MDFGERNPHMTNNIVTIETVRVEGEASTGLADEGQSRSTYFESTSGTIVNVIPGDGGGGERGAVSYDDRSGRWHTSVITDNSIDAGSSAFFNYHVVTIGDAEPPAPESVNAPADHDETLTALGQAVGEIVLLRLAVLGFTVNGYGAGPMRLTHVVFPDDTVLSAAAHEIVQEIAQQYGFSIDCQNRHGDPIPVAESA